MTATLDHPMLEASLARLTRLYTHRCAEVGALLAGIPAAIPCDVHGTPRLLSRELSAKAWRPVYAPCPNCLVARQEANTVERLRRAGVPHHLCGATLDNWQAATEMEQAHLEKIRSFLRTRRGFLLLLGELGTGKTHLAAAITRDFRNPMFIKQSELLRRLRATYRDRAARDPVDHAQDTDLLVLDEIGCSGGGRDELPMLHDVLDHRHSGRKPTVLTGNLTFEELELVIGERMADRLRESAFAVLVFGGRSRRREARDRYFEAKK